jgi:hypothetical protein
MADVLDVGGAPGRRVDVHDERALLRDLEDAFELRVTGRVLDRAPEQEAELQRGDAGLARLGQGGLGSFGVRGPGRHPEAADDPVVPRGGLQHQLVQAERDLRVGHPVVGQDQRPIGALGVQAS